jgi:nucleoside phosphorylase
MDFDGLDHIIMCGIAGGVPHLGEPQEHVRLGDIVVSNRKGVRTIDTIDCANQETPKNKGRKRTLLAQRHGVSAWKIEKLCLRP